MTDKQRRFIDEYMVDLNATQAAIRAGFNPHSAGNYIVRIMKKPEVRAAIERKMAEAARRTEANADRVVRELARIAFLDPTTVVDPRDAEIRKDACEDDRACIASVKVEESDTGVKREVRFYDKNRALELLGKHLGMFQDKTQLELNAPVQVVVHDDIGSGKA